MLASFLSECMKLSRFETNKTSVVIKQLLKLLKTSNKHKLGRAASLRGLVAKNAPKTNTDDMTAEFGLVSCLSYIFRRGLFELSDEPTQLRATQIFADFISEKKRTRQQTYLALNEIGYLLYKIGKLYVCVCLCVCVCVCVCVCFFGLLCFFFCLGVECIVNVCVCG